ncbi:an1 zinc finger protein [Gigaspora margarita]|uniref:An1 zinc finger protein n=2 Tax=Gigaspora margarita TaxID=4874 RepID=A0A8H3XJ54_GIGMA|nr:an1 zinc finger protein [Gigaspora margarita]
MLLVPQNETEDKILEEHKQSNCTLHLLSSIPSATQKKCNLKLCNNKSSEGGVMIYVVCDGCGDMFCLKHRHPPTHQCASLNIASENKVKRREMAEELIAKYFKKTNSDTNDNTSTSSTSSKSQSFTAKPKKKGNKMIEVMKLKSKAQGDSSIPTDARLYLNVEFLNNSNVVNKPMFFNKNWTIGKVLDKTAIEGKFRNENNRIAVDDPNRLVLLNVETGNILNTEKKSCELLESGDSIRLEKLKDIKLD